MFFFTTYHVHWLHSWQIFGRSQLKLLRQLRQFRPQKFRSRGPIVAAWWGLHFCLVVSLRKSPNHLTPFQFGESQYIVCPCLSIHIQQDPRSPWWLQMSHLLRRPLQPQWPLQRLQRLLRQQLPWRWLPPQLALRFCREWSVQVDLGMSQTSRCLNFRMFAFNDSKSVQTSRNGWNDTSQQHWIRASKMNRSK